MLGLVHFYYRKIPSSVRYGVMRDTDSWRGRAIFALLLLNTIIDYDHGLMNHKDTKAKCRHLKQLICKGTLRHDLAASCEENKRDIVS